MYPALIFFVCIKESFSLKRDLLAVHVCQILPFSYLLVHFELSFLSIYEVACQIAQGYKTNQL